MPGNKQKSECVLTDDRRKLVRLNPTLQQAVTFKLVGPRSSSALRALLEEAGDLYGEPHTGVGVWPNADGTIELYSPWASTMKGLLAYGLKKDGGKGSACQTYEACEQEFVYRLAAANVRLVYGIGSDDRLFNTLIEELERRQVRLGWDAVILIGDWDSFVWSSIAHRVPCGSLCESGDLHGCRTETDPGAVDDQGLVSHRPSRNRFADSAPGGL